MPSGKKSASGQAPAKKASGQGSDEPARSKAAGNSQKKPAAGKKKASGVEVQVKSTPRVVLIGTNEEANAVVSSIKNAAKGLPNGNVNAAEQFVPGFFLVDFFSDSTNPAALTLLVNDYCAVFDLTRLPLSKLKHLMKYLEDVKKIRLVVENSVIAALAFHSVSTEENRKTFFRTQILYDIQLGHELHDGSATNAFLGTASRLGLTLAHPAPVLPAKGNFLQPFYTRARNLRCVFDTLKNCFNNEQMSLWMTSSTASVRRLLWESNLEPWLGYLSVGFDSGSFTMASLAVLEAKEKKAANTNVSCVDEKRELQLLLDLLPRRWAAKLGKEAHRQLIDIEVDIGRPAFAFFRIGPKLILSEGRDDNVTSDQLWSIEEELEDTGAEIGADNRTGIIGSLHRVSVIRGRDPDEIIGVTLRASKHIYGVSSILYDVLLSEEHENDSVLLVGPPGSGKTTMSRDIARLLSERQRVIIVDSSDEIGGPGQVTHRCIGDARRMSVPGGKHKLAKKLIEAVENHTPDVLVADELSDKDEVAGASTAKLRGVRAISSAHGNLRSLIKNAVLRGLVGGIERVILSDKNAGPGAKGKVQTVRAGDPIFDVVVEMGVVKGDPTACRVTRDTGKAVDAVLKGKQYPCEMRRRGCNGEILVQSLMA